jgi:hypothetical protein
VLYARADGDYRTEIAQRPVLASAAVQVRKGISALGASDAGDPQLTRAFAKPDAWVVRGTSAVDVAFTDRLTGQFRGQAQYSGSTLLPYEQISIGGLTVGRGYDPAALLGDKGVSGAFEVRYGPLQLHPKVVAAPYVFFDAGYVANNNARASGLGRDRTLTSTGAGVIFRLFNRANFEVTYAHPLDAVRAGGSRPGDRVLIQLTQVCYRCGGGVPMHKLTRVRVADQGRHRLLSRTALCGALYGLQALLPTAAHAQTTSPPPSTAIPLLPQGGLADVSAGGGAPVISTSAAQMDVTLHAPRTVLSWTTFNVGPEQSVNFKFDAKSWIVLNKIVGLQPSKIEGRSPARSAPTSAATSGSSPTTASSSAASRRSTSAASWP